MKSGILYILNAMLKKYDRSLGGIVIGYQNIKVLMDENTGIIPIGTSETEVNVSLDFYIFQPKIGNYLEGVINKKSSTHIGCLVHQYFNATILKPDDVDDDDWICKDFSIDDRVTFKVKDLDFTTLLPYIEGIVEEKNLLEKNTKSDRCDSHVMINHVNEISESKSLFSKTVFKDLNTENKFKGELDGQKAKNRNEEEVSISEENLNTSTEFTSLNSPKKKKKKEKEKNAVDLEDHNKKEEEKYSKDQELPSFSSNSEFREEERHSKKKKKKKEKEKNECHDNKNQNSLFKVKNSTKEEDPVMTLLAKRLELQDENSCDFVKELKSKKVKKKKRKEKDEEYSLDSSETSACLPTEEVEDDLLCSTQLEPSPETKKMTVPLFSPIPVDNGVEKKTNSRTTIQDLSFSMRFSSDKESQEREKKKKHKKRKIEENKESTTDCPTPKKMKTSHSHERKAPKPEVNGVDVKSPTQMMMEEMYEKLINEAKEKLNVSSDKVSSKVKKKKKESKKKEKEKEKKARHGELLKANKSSVAQVNGSEERPKVQSIVDRLLENERKRLEKTSKKEKIKSSDERKIDKLKKKLLKERLRMVLCSEKTQTKVS